MIANEFKRKLNTVMGLILNSMNDNYVIKKLVFV